MGSLLSVIGAFTNAILSTFGYPRDTPASHSLTGSVPVIRVGKASGTVDLQRDLGGAVMQSIFGALLAVGYTALACDHSRDWYQSGHRQQRSNRAGEVLWRR
jgi:hypothetical protein